jgi:hypothetical protein
VIQVLELGGALTNARFEQIPVHSRKSSLRSKWRSPQPLVHPQHHLSPGTNYLSRSATHQLRMKTNSKSSRRIQSDGCSAARVSPSNSTQAGKSTSSTVPVLVSVIRKADLSCISSCCGRYLQCLAYALVGGGRSRDVVPVWKPLGDG